MAGESARLRWHKSQRSGATDCVEIAVDEVGAVVLRDSRDPEGPALRLDRATWQAFLADLKTGRFDLPDEDQRPSSGAPTVQ